MTAVSDAGLYRLMTWLSPSFPVGAFSYSQGLEAAIAAGLVTCERSMAGWLQDSLAGGPLWSDAVIFARAHDAGRSNRHFNLIDVVNFATAFQPSAELRMETLAQGTAFMSAALLSWPCGALETLRQAAGMDVAYPVAVAVAAAGHGIGERAALHAWLHAAIANQVSAAIRLVPLGQNQGQRLLAGIETQAGEARDAALLTPLSRLSTNCLMADICSMNHETQHTRLFRS
jgi:urease accessory protein